MKTTASLLLIAATFSTLVFTSCKKEPCPCEEQNVTLTQEKAEVTAKLADQMAAMDSVMTSFEDIEALKTAFQEAKNSNDTLKATEVANLIKAKFEASDKRIAELDKQLAKSNRKASALKKVVANLKAQLEQARTEVSLLSGKVQELSTTVEEQSKFIAEKDAELGEVKGENAALNANLRETQRKAFLEKGETFIERGKAAESNGDGLNSLINGKKKKAQYQAAKEFYQQAVDHFTTIPGGLGGYSQDSNERKEFDAKLAEAKKLLEQVNAKLK